MYQIGALGQPANHEHASNGVNSKRHSISSSTKQHRRAMHGSVSIRAKLHIVDEHKCHPTLRPQSLCIVCPACHPFVRQGYELQEPPGKLCPYNFGSVFTVEIGGICICGVTRPIRPQCLFILRTKWHVCSALLTDLINSAQTARPLFSQDFIAREHKRAKMQSTAN